MQWPGVSLFQFFDTGRHSSTVESTKDAVPVTTTAIDTKQTRRTVRCGKRRR